MSLPWNRGDPDDSSDSWLALLPMVDGDAGLDSGRAPERSEPKLVAGPGAGNDVRDAPPDRAPSEAAPAVGGEQSRRSDRETEARVDREPDDREISIPP